MCEGEERQLHGDVEVGARQVLEQGGVRTEELR